MADRGESTNRGPRRPPAGGTNRGGRPAAPPGRRSGEGTGGGARPQPKPAIPRKAGGLSLRRVGGDDFELIHPRCVAEMELDYAEGIELLEAGDPESARDALRYALQGCGDNIWVHVALGRIALDEFKDPTLARGHYGYAFELAQKAMPADFRGRLPKSRPSNAPLHDAIDGLVRCYEALGQEDEAGPLKALVARWGGRPRGQA